MERNIIFWFWWLTLPASRSNKPTRGTNLFLMNVFYETKREIFTMGVLYRNFQNSWLAVLINTIQSDPWPCEHIWYHYLNKGRQSANEQGCKMARLQSEEDGWIIILGLNRHLVTVERWHQCISDYQSSHTSLTFLLWPSEGGSRSPVTFRVIIHHWLSYYDLVKVLAIH